MSLRTYFYVQNGNQIYYLSPPICAYILYECKGENDAHFSKHENAHCFLFKECELAFSVNVKIIVCALYKINRCLGPVTQKHSSINVCMIVRVHTGDKIKFIFNLSHYCPYIDIPVQLLSTYHQLCNMVSACSKLIFISEMSKAEVYWRSVTFCKCTTKATMLPSAGGVVEMTLTALNGCL